MPAVLTYIIIANCLGNLHNYAKHEKSSGSDSLRIITFFFRHEQQRSLHLCGTLSSLQLQCTRPMLALGAVHPWVAKVGCACLPWTGESGSASVAPEETWASDPKLTECVPACAQTNYNEPIMCVYGFNALYSMGKLFGSFPFQIKPFPDPSWDKMQERNPASKFIKFYVSLFLCYWQYCDELFFVLMRWADM